MEVIGSNPIRTTNKKNNKNFIGKKNIYLKNKLYICNVKFAKEKRWISGELGRGTGVLSSRG